ncbi:hypothetical protein TWF481_012329 [Arthrobotrys musiformis]|uniref:MULE transposase domain-containing protein n=1 Tax=Arthrobotrys musiformis TaxID=47236 RepID=A0AAV9VQN6_9PEZI
MAELPPIEGPKPELEREIERYNYGIPQENLIFESRDAAFEYLHDFALSNGYAVSKAQGSDSMKLRLKCHKGGQFDNRQKRPDALEPTIHRMTASKLTGCPFLLTVNCRVDSKWYLSLHNHPPTGPEAMVGISKFRQLSKEQQDRVATLGLKLPPRKVPLVMQAEDPQFQAIAKDVSNVVAKARREKLGGKSPIEYLFNYLKDSYRHAYKVDSFNRVTHLFVTFSGAIKLTKLHHGVIVLDSTYKTNRYKMPLLHGVGVISGYKTFTSFVVFMRGETQVDYSWAIGAMKQAFDVIPPVFLTDCDKSLMAALTTHYPTSANDLCV